MRQARAEPVIPASQKGRIPRRDMRRPDPMRRPVDFIKLGTKRARIV
jgi:hypothetical protein